MFSLYTRLHLRRSLKRANRNYRADAAREMISIVDDPFRWPEARDVYLADREENPLWLVTARSIATIISLECETPETGDASDSEGEKAGTTTTESEDSPEASKPGTEKHSDTVESNIQVENEENNIEDEGCELEEAGEEEEEDDEVLRKEAVIFYGLMEYHYRSADPNTALLERIAARRPQRRHLSTSSGRQLSKQSRGPSPLSQVTTAGAEEAKSAPEEHMGRKRRRNALSPPPDSDSDDEPRQRKRRWRKAVRAMRAERMEAE